VRAISSGPWLSAIPGTTFTPTRTKVSSNRPSMIFFCNLNTSLKPDYTSQLFVHIYKSGNRPVGQLYSNYNLKLSLRSIGLEPTKHLTTLQEVLFPVLNPFFEKDFLQL
jgi:hypothetical protein